MHDLLAVCYDRTVAGLVERLSRLLGQLIKTIRHRLLQICRLDCLTQPHGATPHMLV